MEQNFQTSFIPKKPMVAERAIPARSVGIVTVIAFFLLFTVLLATGGIYFYKGILGKNIAAMQNQLEVAKNRFEPEKITELELLDRRLRASTEILSRHISVSPIFQALSAVTMKTVRYTSFNYVLGDKEDAKVLIKMSGEAVGYRSVALQSDLFANDKNLIDPIFSNLMLNEKGNVLFDLEFLVDPAFVDYKRTVLTQN